MELNDLKITTSFFDESYLKIDFEWMTLCDKSCSYCYNLKHEDRYMRDADKIKSSLLKILSMDYDNIVISLIGGEILLSPFFNEVCEFLIENCKPSHKFLLFTHAQHKPSFFKKKLDPLLKIKDQVRVVCSVHFEEMNYENFEANAVYVNDSFGNGTFAIFPDNDFKKNKEWLKGILHRNKNFHIHPIIYDKVNSSLYEKAKNHVHFKTIDTEFKEFSDRSETQYVINGKEYTGIEGKVKVFFDYNFAFKDTTCTIRAFETRMNGDMFYSCGWDKEPVANIFRDSVDVLNERVKIITVKCPLESCLQNICLISLKND